MEGLAEAAASVVFGLYFLLALALAYRGVRRRDIAAHRRWMIRAFAVALGVGSVRIWIGLFQLVGLLSISANAGTTWFGVAFWLAFLMHAATAELYLFKATVVTVEVYSSPTALAPVAVASMTP
jgi:predicted membrane protein DUF2306